MPHWQHALYTLYPGACVARGMAARYVRYITLEVLLSSLQPVWGASSLGHSSIGNLMGLGPKEHAMSWPVLADRSSPGCLPRSQGLTHDAAGSYDAGTAAGPGQRSAGQGLRCPPLGSGAGEGEEGGGCFGGAGEFGRRTVV